MATRARRMTPKGLWRRHHRRTRVLKNMLDKAVIGDPLGLVASPLRQGLLTKLEIAVQDEVEYFARRRQGENSIGLEERAAR